MLILTRKPGERIIIANHIVIEVKEITGQHVRLGIKAPADIRIEREERYNEREAKAHG